MPVAILCVHKHRHIGTLRCEVIPDEISICAGIGDADMAQQAFHIAIAMDSMHGEALTNLGVLEVRQGHDTKAMSHFQAAQKLAPHGYEAWYNGALISMRAGNLQDCYSQAQSASAAFPDHTDTQDLLRLQSQFDAL